MTSCSDAINEITASLCAKCEMREACQTPDKDRTEEDMLKSLVACAKEAVNDSNTFRQENAETTVKLVAEIIDRRHGSGLQDIDEAFHKMGYALIPDDGMYQQPPHETHD